MTSVGSGGGTGDDCCRAVLKGRGDTAVPNAVDPLFVAGHDVSRIMSR